MCCRLSALCLARPEPWKQRIASDAAEACGGAQVKDNKYYQATYSRISPYADPAYEQIEPYVEAAHSHLKPVSVNGKA